MLADEAESVGRVRLQQKKGKIRMIAVPAALFEALKTY